MTYVYLNYNEMKSVISELKNYAGTVKQVEAEIRQVNENNNGAGDTSGLTSWGELIATLDDNTAEIHDRVETAKRLNENGLSPMKGELISYIVPDEMEDTTGIIVTHAKGVMDANELTKLASERWKTEDEVWNGLINRLRNNQNDEVYADAVLSHIGAEGMLDLPYEAMLRFGKTPVRPSYQYNNPQAMHDLNNIFGQMLSTASHKWGDEKSSSFANQLADAAQSSKSSTRMLNLNSILFTTEQKGDEATALDYNDAMLLTLARRLEAFEDRADDAPDAVFRGVSSIEYPSELGYFNDPLPGVVRAMTANPSAALEWLAPSDPSKIPLTGEFSENMIGRIENLVGRCNFAHENWTEDWSAIADRISRGDANHRLTVIQHSYEDTRNTAAVSGIMNGVGDHLEHWVIRDHLSDKTRSRIGDVLSRYPAGIDRSTLKGDGNKKLMNDKGYDGAQPVLADKALRNLIVGMGEHPRFNTSIQRHHDSQVENALRNYSSPNRESEIQIAFDDHNRTNGFITGSHSWYGERLGEDMDKDHGNVKKVASTIASYFSVPDIATDAIYDLAFSPNNGKEADKRSEDLLNYTRDLSTDRLTLATLRFKNDPLTQEEFRFTEEEINSLCNDADIEAGLFNENKELTLSDDALREKGEQQVNVALTNAAGKVSVVPGKSSIAQDVGLKFDEGYNHARGIK